MYKQHSKTELSATTAAPEQLIRHIAARRLPVSALKSVCILTAALAAGTAQAATYIVDTTKDGPTGQVDGCSLREAITSLSAITPQDIGGCTHTGAFGSGDTVDLSMLKGTIRLDPDAHAIGVQHPITITGPALGSNGKPTLTIRGIKGKQPDRIFDIFSGSATSISNLTLTGGQTAANSQGGGAIKSGSDLTLTNCVVTGNATLGEFSTGGGLFVFGNTTLVNSTVSNNQTRGDNANGGGMSSTTATLTNSTVTRNQTRGYSSTGGGLNVYGNATLNDSTISGNKTSGKQSFGGGLFVLGDAVLNNSTVSGNQTSGINGSGGGLAVYGNATLNSSTVSGNQTKGAVSNGGGVAAYDNLALGNSTVSGNKTSGESSYGGGVYVKGLVTLSNSTIAFNSSKGVEDGIAANPAKTFAANNSIIAQSKNGEKACNTPIDSGSNNLIANKDGDDSSCGGTQVTLKALNLDRLKVNGGGDTQTHALKAGSVAIDTGADGVCPPADQNGTTRPQGLHCDIGSYEFVP